MFSRNFLSCLFVAAAGLLAACGGRSDAATAPKTAADWFDLRLGARTVRVQVAALADEQERGLMFRQSLGADEGMIFVFTRPQQMSFWMRNTEIPLDIGYFDAAGVLKEVYPMFPHDERSVASRSRELQFCLEMNQGWFQRAGVKPGDKLELKDLAGALRDRGLKPEIAGLRD